MSGNCMRILVVQDQADLAEIATDYLKSQGHEVEAVPSAAEALERAPSLKPDLVMFDVRLADPERSMFAKNLRSLPGLEETMVVVGLSLPRGAHLAY